MVLYGGRGSGKSWAVARYLILLAQQTKHRILCLREFQNSIADSVHKLLSDQIELMGFSDNFIKTKTEIKCLNGSQFLFFGLHHNADSIKSMEGISAAWVEEGQTISEESLDILIPTIRMPKSKIIVTFNPHRKTDPVYRRFLSEPRDEVELIQANYDSNPDFPETLLHEMDWDKKTNYDRYLWIWAGNPVGISAAQIFRGKYFIDETPEPDDKDRLFYGVDWGFANDPNAIVRCFIRGRILYVDYEAGGVGIEIDELPELFRQVPDIEKWPIFADCARPETISHMKRQGYKISGAPKWAGSVEDGIGYMKGFEKIIINPRCKHIIEEMELYQYKQDKLTGEILPIIVDKNNHYEDALRYALSSYIKQKNAAVFAL